MLVHKLAQKMFYLYSVFRHTYYITIDYIIIQPHIRKNKKLRIFEFVQRPWKLSIMQRYGFIVCHKLMSLEPFFLLFLDEKLFKWWWMMFLTTSILLQWHGYEYDFQIFSAIIFFVHHSHVNIANLTRLRLSQSKTYHK